MIKIKNFIAKMEPIVVKDVLDLLAIAQLKNDVERKWNTKVEDDDHVEGLWWCTGQRSEGAKKLCLSPDARFLAVLKEAEIELWDVTDKQIMFSQPAVSPSHACWRNSTQLAFIEDGEKAKELSVNGDLTAHAQSNITRIAFSTEGQAAYVMHKDSYKVVVEGQSCCLFESYNMIRALAWSQDGKWLAIAQDSSVHIYDVNAKRIKQYLQVDFFIEQAFFPASSHRLVLAGWAVQRGGKVPILMSGHQVDEINLGPPGINIFTIIKRYKLADTDECDCEIYEHCDQSETTATEDCKYYFQSAGKKLKMYARRGRLIWCVDLHYSDIRSITANSKNKTIVTLDKNGSIIFWNWS